MTSSTIATRLIVFSFSQSYTVKAERCLRLFDEASAIAICKGGDCLTRLTKYPRVHPPGMQRYRQQELSLCWGRQSPDDVLKTLSDQMHKAGANLQPTFEFQVADELPDRFHAMKQR